MSFFSDLFGGADAAAAAQTAGLTQGLDQATQWTDAGNKILAATTGQAVAPFQQNFDTATGGVAGLTNALGLNGPAGSQSALTALKTTPGYQFQLGQGNNAINAAAAANGTLGSGNQAIALDQFGQGLAGTTYNNYVGQLQPFLGAAGSAAGGIGSVYGNEGSQANANFQNLGNNAIAVNAGIGNAQASADLANQGIGLGILGGALGFLGNGGAGGSANSFIGKGLTSLFSDERLKEDIEPVGELYDGTGVYRYRYIGDDTPRIGVMAQEVMRDRPEAVHDIGGWLAVDYGAATNRAAELARFLEAA